MMLFAQATMYLQLPVLLVLISLVYSATRYDDWPSILNEAFRWGSRMLGFLLCIAVAMYVLSFLPRST
jgi:hypothetical protein